MDMANERKTEKIVREHFGEDSAIIKIEEQSSDIPKIDKLLKTASKKGEGKGRPEFIITFNKNNDFLIVVECKADITKHESAARDKFAEYAVDGVLLYASFLSKEYDVLAIAVSGETQQQLKISHFLHLKGERKAVSMFGDKLLPAQDYLNGYLKSPEKFRQDYNTLLAFTKTLNEKLHTYKILESQRSLLLSCVLIALEYDAFRASYDKMTNPKNLADFLVKTVSDKLENANITRDKLDNLNIQFGFIKTDTSLTTKDGLLKELIDEIDSNINQFIKTHEYFDVLGQLYIEFLKYANSDKGLGIVLTPPHITEFFAELAQVNKNSIIYDNCAGTGGFLISAMKYMIKDAKGDEEKIREIKSSQLIGTEYQAHIFALAVSNMYIHQDGKTNIINGDCFDKNVIKQIKTKKPTVGVLNPPYQGNKKTDIDELEFILNNLECLVDGGTCIAIVPMQKALATSGKIAELKKKLLNKHTLEAVLSMPDELFFNSDVNVVTCVMIFTAHRKHSPTKKTYFGYYKDDGFIKRKIQGRFDGLGKWESIKKKWVGYFLDENRKEEAGFSVNRVVTEKDEWCAEAYMETDYSKLTERDFEDTVLNYVTFLLNNRINMNNE
jgi:type I restriction-modification system DNA methylase subunit